MNRTIGSRILSCALVNLIAAALFVSPAAAQTASNQKWEVEVHGGGMFSSRSSDGTATLPAPGAAFTTFTGFPSRRVSSWYFGDGSQLFNDLPASVRQNQSITSLNAPLGRGATSKSGGSIGGRLGYAITPRLTAEFSIDYGWSSIDIDSDAPTEIEASRASFLTAWNGALAIFGSPTVTSTISTDEGSSHQLAMSGVVISEPSPPSGASPDALGDLWPVVPTTERVFHVTGEATAFVRLYQGTRPAPGPVSISIQVVDERGRPVRAHAETIDSVRFGSTRTAGVSFPLPLSALDPGAYALSIEARRDGQPPVTSRVAFAVRDR